ncbi:MAG: hypothetical protein LBB38_00565 [Puniceicoccales bacterium]|jgi:hypothetical protein|nr:hypothetical protein [Puniceicoccales bacterium]
MADQVSAADAPKPVDANPNSQKALSGVPKKLLVAATVINTIIGAAAFFLWLALKVFGAPLISPAVAAMVCTVVSWAMPAFVMIGCALLAVWLFKVWRPASPETVAAK